jgi:hypothetical protein
VKRPRYSIRTLLFVTTAVAISLGLVAWNTRRFTKIVLTGVTPGVANSALDGFATVPSEALDVRIDYRPFSIAEIEFSMKENDAQLWCRRNDWKITKETTGVDFDFITPNGTGRWFEDRVVLFVFSK